jgi:hypothetical protein
MKFQIQVEVDGKPEFAIGFWEDTEDAVKWMNRFDDFFADLERDLAKENQRIENGFNVVEVETVVALATDKFVVNDKSLWESQVAE